jgi:hypothetical protein
MFGKQSAHGNNPWFMKKMVKLRGKEWQDDLIEKGNEVLKWKQEIDNIRKELE